MYYALIDMRGTCVATTALAWGELKNVADMVITECQQLIDATALITKGNLEDVYHCEFEDFKSLLNSANPTASQIESFSFVLQDCTIDVVCLVEGYPALVEAWNEYRSDKMTLECWDIAEEIEETDENLNKLDEELRSLNDDLGMDDYEFFTESEYDDEEFDD